MKKTISIILTFVLLFSVMAVSVSAIPAGCTAVDVTANVKFSSAWEMYKNGTPIIRDDAVYVGPDAYDVTKDGYASPGTGTRNVVITDFDSSAYMDQLQYDLHWNGGNKFQYNCIWANNPEGGTSKLSYKFTVEEAGTYEFVIVGAAQITTANRNNDEKDRGFSYSIDGGDKYQVNISDTQLICNAYTYEYTTAEAEATIADGTREYYQMGYVYNIKAELTAGEHYFEYYHLEYSGDTVLNTGNGPRLNFAGFYYQKYLDEVAILAYTYPKYVETTAEPTTEPETTEKVTTEEATEDVADPTDAPDGTGAPGEPAATTDASTDDAQSGGCGSFVAGGVVVIALISAAAFAVKKKEN